MDPHDQMISESSCGDDHQKKLLKISLNESWKEASSDHPVMWYSGSAIFYDSYELLSLTHVIERHLMALPTSAAPGNAATNTRLTLTTKFWPPVSEGSQNALLGRQRWMKRKAGERKDGGSSKRLRKEGCFCAKLLIWKNWLCFSKTPPVN